MKEEKKGSFLKKARNRLMFTIVIFFVGLAVGYYLGYDVGFEKAARILSN